MECVCVVCGKVYDSRDSGYALYCSCECSSKHFWDSVVKEPKSFMAENGEAYTIGKENSYERGFDGAKFKVEYEDGTEVITSNLWHRGTVPPEYKDKIIKAKLSSMR